jgi:hypothetical protein
MNDSSEAAPITGGETKEIIDEFEFSPLALPEETDTDEKITIVGMNACR